MCFTRKIWRICTSTNNRTSWIVRPSQLIDYFKDHAQFQKLVTTDLFFNDCGVHRMGFLLRQRFSLHLGNLRALESAVAFKYAGSIDTGHPT